MGFSLLSLLEVIHWFTIRLWNDYHKKKKENQDNEPFDD